VEIIKDKADLLLHISETIGKNKVLKLTDILYNRKFAIKDIIELTFYPEREVAFRAAWILENVFLIDPMRFGDELDVLISEFIKVKNKSCLRHYAKIIMHLTGPKADKALKQKLDKMNFDPVVERCFDLLIDQKTPVAVKAFASQILFNLRLRYTWIKDVLTEQLHIMMQAGKPAIQSKGRKLLSYLDCD
jgi:hypothetical protein